MSKSAFNRSARVDHGAVVLLHHPGQEIPGALRAPARGQASFVREVVLPVEPSLVVEEGIRIERIDGVHDRPRSRRVTDVRPRSVVRIRLAAERPRAREPDGIVSAKTLCHVELRLPHAAALGLDDHYAVGRAGAVDRRGRGGALQHLNRLDVAHDEVGQAVRGIVLIAGDVRAGGGEGGVRDRVGARCDLVVADHHPVHDEQRLAVAEDGRHAADLDLAAATWSPAVHVDEGAGYFALECLLGRLRGDGAEPLSGEVADRDRGVLAFDARGLTGHEDRLEPEDVALEGDLDARLLGRDAGLAALVPDRARTERQGGGGYDDAKLTALVGLRGLNAAHDRNSGVRHGFFRGGVHHLPCDLSILRLRKGRGTQGQQHRSIPRTSGHNTSRTGRNRGTAYAVACEWATRSRYGGTPAGMRCCEVACILSARPWP